MSTILYFAPGSCAFASLIALEEAEIPFEPRSLNLAAGQQRTVEYRKINRRGRIPALTVDGVVIAETIAILCYAASRAPESKLLPEDPLRAGQILCMASWLASSVHVSVAQIFRGERFVDDESIKAELAVAGKARLRTAYAEIEQSIVGPWVFGDDFSLIYPYLVPFWRWGERLDMDMSAYPLWQEHTKRVLARPSARRALEIEASPNWAVSSFGTNL